MKFAEEQILSKIDSGVRVLNLELPSFRKLDTRLLLPIKKLKRLELFDNI